MRTADFDYDLPPELIAQEPAARRDASRLLVLRRAGGAREHRRMADLPDLLAPGDLLVLNNTRVTPSRLFARKAETGGRVELLFLEAAAPGEWDVLLRAHHRPRPGDRLLLDAAGAAATFVADGRHGAARLRLEAGVDLPALLEREGQMPLPPYIRRKAASPERAAADRERYQTVYASRPGAVAAPTAGLHFTPELFARLAARGVARTEVTLHVGPGTFRPVTAERVEEHRMDAERWELPAETAAAVAAARARGGRVVAVGSTSVRTLETAAARPEGFGPGAGRTELFIVPPHTFRVVDGLLTNFHLPRSTLLMMVCAFAGRDAVLGAYADAIREHYRFFSYGDAMLIL